MSANRAPTPTLHPQAASVLALVEKAANPEYHEMAAHEARAAHEERSSALALAAEPLPRVHDLQLPGPAGPLTARCYQPQKDLSSPLPVVLWLHGGGHTVGSVDGYDSICRRLAARSRALVVSLEYRLAPEHKFPAALDDAFAALSWLSEQAPAIGGDPDRLAVAGDSAGGNLAAACSLLARDRGLQSLRFQLLVYPALAPHPDLESHRRFAHGYLLTLPAIRWFQAQYLRSEADRLDWRFAPLIAPDLGRLAPALIMVAGHDPLRDEGIAYARALAEAGSAVDLVNHEGMIHAFWSLGAAIREASRSIDRAADALRAALAR